MVAASDPEREAVLYVMLFGAPVIWAVLSLLVALSSRGTRLRLTQGLVLLQYASGLPVVATAGARPTGLAGEVPDFFIVWTPVYLAGQVALWWGIIRRNQLRPTGHPPPRADVPVVPGTAPADGIGLRYLSITQIYELFEGWNCAEIPHANLAAQGL